MSIDLTLIPEEYDLSGNSVLAYNRLRLQCRNYDLYDSLKEVSTPMPEKLLWYCDEGIGETSTDGYGDPITFVTAYLFVKIWDADKSSVSQWDKAVIEFLRALPPSTRIFLWFH